MLLALLRCYTSIYDGFILVIEKFYIRQNALDTFAINKRFSYSKHNTYLIKGSRNKKLVFYGQPDRKIPVFLRLPLVGQQISVISTKLKKKGN